MNVATARITLRLPASHSLKDKRRVVKSICQRTQNRFNVSIAEVEAQDLWQTTSLALPAYPAAAGTLPACSIPS